MIDEPTRQMVMQLMSLVALFSFIGGYFLGHCTAINQWHIDEELEDYYDELEEELD